MAKPDWREAQKAKTVAAIAKSKARQADIEAADAQRAGEEPFDAKQAQEDGAASATFRPGGVVEVTEERGTVEVVGRKDVPTIEESIRKINALYDEQPAAKQGVPIDLEAVPQDEGLSKSEIRRIAVQQEAERAQERLEDAEDGRFSREGGAEQDGEGM